ncbi:uncharacterized protein LOC143030876 isoform X3 [Oratosquilla oratoria]|uniref:uncharacterized protein LOC143030876 isoform X3 n=1 Tax=Oratosquilla oratoria TaxID=337810 RepID=UPI003F773C77
MYSVVVFVDEVNVDMVPTKLIFAKEKKSYCYWPSKRRESKLRRAAVREQADPLQGWETCEVRVIHQACNYEACRKNHRGSRGMRAHEELSPQNAHMKNCHPMRSHLKNCHPSMPNINSGIKIRSY